MFAHEETTMIRVWGRRSSVNVQKVLWTLAELDIPFARETVGGSFGGNRDADFLRMNPNGLVPVIQDGGVTMFESNAIVRYLCAHYRAGLLRPEAVQPLAAAEQWMEWQQTTFAPHVSAIFWNTVRVPSASRNKAAVTDYNVSHTYIRTIPRFWCDSEALESPL